MKEDLLSQFKHANEHRDYGLYTKAMDAALGAKAEAIFPHFGSLQNGDIIVDAGSGTGKLAVLAAQTFPETTVVAMDISPALLQEAEENKEYIQTKFGNAVEQNFPDNSIAVKYFSTSGHEIETFGGPGSMREALVVSHRELKQGGRVVIRDFAKPSSADPLLMHILSNIGQSTISPDRPIDYNTLSATALFERFHTEFQGGNAFDYEVVEKNGTQFIRLLPEWAHEFYLRKDYTGNWRNEIKEKYTYWSPEEAVQHAEEVGFKKVRVIPELNKYIYENRLLGKIGLYKEQADILTPLPFPPTHMVLIGKK